MVIFGWKDNVNKINQTTIKTTITMFNFPLLYLFVNLYTGESKWCSLEEGANLGEYWEQDQDGSLWLYLGKPVRYFEVFRVNPYNGAKVLTPYIKDFGLNKEDYADLKWEDEPVEVFLNLKN